MRVFKIRPVHEGIEYVFTQPLPPQAVYEAQLIFLAGYNWSELSFLSRRLVAVRRLKSLVCPTIYLKQEEDFPKVISAKWNGNSIVQDSNYCCLVYFLRR